jgi:hypothetical protein
VHTVHWSGTTTQHPHRWTLDSMRSILGRLSRGHDCLGSKIALPVHLLNPRMIGTTCCTTTVQKKILQNNFWCQTLRLKTSHRCTGTLPRLCRRLLPRGHQVQTIHSGNTWKRPNTMRTVLRAPSLSRRAFGMTHLFSCECVLGIYIECTPQVFNWASIHL